MGLTEVMGIEERNRHTGNVMRKRRGRENENQPKKKGRRREKKSKGKEDKCEPGREHLNKKKSKTDIKKTE